MCAPEWYPRSINRSFFYPPPSNKVDLGALLFYREIMKYMDLLTIEPGKRSDKPCIRGMRMTVSDGLDYLASVMTFGEIIKDFPDPTLEDIRACHSFAAARENFRSFLRHEAILGPEFVL
jgi:uncharacterized protein (DUF433 family)